MSTKIAIITDLHIGFAPKKLKTFKHFIANLDADILIICGDITTSKPSEMEAAFKVIKETNPLLKTLCVFGNHDIWDSESKFDTLDELRIELDRLCKLYGVHYLENNKYEDDELLIWGYDGWYNNLYPPSNDEHWMPERNSLGVSPHLYLQKKELEAMEYIRNDIPKYKEDKRTKICVTHFNPFNYGSCRTIKMAGSFHHFDELVDHMDYFFFGHTHLFHDSMVGDCRVMNVGADYNHSPNHRINKYFKVIEIDKKD